MLMYEDTVSLIVYQAWIHIELHHIACCYLVSSVQYVSHHYSTGRCASVVSKFLELDPEKDDVLTFLKDYVLPTAEGFL